MNKFKNSGVGVEDTNPWNIEKVPESKIRILLSAWQQNLIHYIFKVKTL